MNYSEPLINQITVFCRAAGCGILLGILYDGVSLIRMTVGEKKGIYVFFDTVYFLLASVVSFFFMVLYNSGQVRLNLMLAELVGGAAFHFSLGRYVLEGYSLQLNRVRCLASFMARPFVRTAEGIRDFFLEKMTKKRKKRPGAENKEKISKKLSDIGKFLLKNKNKSV